MVRRVAPCYPPTPPRGYGSGSGGGTPKKEDQDHQQAPPAPLASDRLLSKMLTNAAVLVTTGEDQSRLSGARVGGEEQEKRAPLLEKFVKKQK